jgi:hypothetical protein
MEGWQQIGVELERSETWTGAAEEANDDDHC